MGLEEATSTLGPSIVIDAATSALAQWWPPLATTLTMVINLEEQFQRIYRANLATINFLISIHYFVKFPVEHVRSGILKTVVKRHAPPIARIIEPLQILLAQFLNRSVVLLF